MLPRTNCETKKCNSDWKWSHCTCFYVPSLLTASNLKLFAYIKGFQNIFFAHFPKFTIFYFHISHAYRDIKFSTFYQNRCNRFQHKGTSHELSRIHVKILPMKTSTIKGFSLRCIYVWQWIIFINYVKVAQINNNTPLLQQNKYHHFLYLIYWMLLKHL